MYDEDDHSPEVSSWYGEARPDRAAVVHLCPECRDLMSEVVRHARALADATGPPVA